MPIDLTPIPSTTSTGGKNRLKLIELTRFYIDKYGEDWLSDSDAMRIDAGDLLDLALTRWYEATQCSRGTYTLAAVASQATYARSAFPSGATRIYDLYYVTYNSTKLTPTTVDKMDAFNQNWRTATAGTPTKWMPWGDSDIRLYPAPSGTSNIIIEGFQSPDFTAFDADTDEPPGVNVVDHDALPLYAAFMAIFAEQSETGVAKQSWLWQEWQGRIAKATARVAGVGNVKRHMGGRLDNGRTGLVCDETITMA